MTGAVRRLRRLTRRWERGRVGLLRWAVLGSVLVHSMWIASLRLVAVPTAEAEVTLWQLERWSAAPKEPSPVASPMEELTYVAATQPEARPADDVRAISARDQAAQQERRSPEVPRPPGQSLLRQAEGSEPGGQRTVEQSPGATSTLRGGPIGTAAGLATGQRGGGGQDGVVAGRGAPSEAGTRAGGASQQGARSTHDRERHRAGAALPRLTPDSPWWSPTVARLQLAGPPSEGLVAVSERPSQAAALAPSEVHRPKSPRPTPTEVEEPPAPTPPADTPGTERHRVAKPMGDPIAELREALGFGVLDRGRLAPRPRSPGDDYADGAPSSSPRAPLNLPTDWTSEVAARGTPLGRWIEQAEARIVDRWTGLDLSAHDRARGIQGDVTVCYWVTAGGRVTRVEVERSSGLPQLDAMAVTAIPERLPRLPRGTGHDALVHRVTLRYSNPQLRLTPSL